MTINVCDKLTETYDTRYLDNEPQSVQDMFLNVSKESLLTGEGNTTLMKLIANKYDTNSQEARKIPRYLGGPNVFVKMHSDEYNKTIVFLGEYHYGDIKCYNTGDYNENINKTVLVHDWLKQYLQNTDVFIDLYIEQDRFADYSNIPDNVLLIKKLGNMFKECLNTKNRDTFSHCKLSRVHYMENRYTNTTFSNLVFPLKLFTILSVENPTAEQIINHRNIKFFIRYIRKWIYEQNPALKTFLYKEILNNEFVKKAVDKSYMKPLLIKYLYTLIDNTIDNLNPSLITLVSLLRSEPQGSTYIINQFIDIIVILYSPMLDMHILSRIFKVFQVPDGVYHPKEPHNIIVYSGFGHIENTSGFLKQLGFDTIQTERFDQQDRCLNTSNIEPYLF